MQRNQNYRPNGRRLLELRMARDLTMEDVALAAEIDKRTLVEYEDGTRGEKFQYNQLRHLADFYEVSFESLLQPIETSVAFASV
ncbi:helix-turn-helix domain-containing protein [Deinococcus sp. QL22]|uniref:helix-turn-helix domain-containing protein n=1 Tax=Deinococcus sp. QL22 TaxID=2939437 RepID=UPI002017067A|nr:helix-turn-helix transcriptional regulator [Deinococcus sp. QL22]UQN10288.1 helix-turn-helix domain-containing protein [Deinococcus sp. QL22]UQN10422.1 helix-turn-helix domain-containing protein [Deinococcus sp. QL22]